MAVSEIDSFVTKFKYLWHAGFQSSLEIESKHGQAVVTLQAEVGVPPPPPHSYHHDYPQLPRRHRPPSYHRRQQKRHEQAAVLAADNFQQKLVFKMSPQKKIM